MTVQVEQGQRERKSESLQSVELAQRATRQVLRPKAAPAEEGRAVERAALVGSVQAERVEPVARKAFGRCFPYVLCVLDDSSITS